MVRAGGHAISSKIEAKLMRKADFDSIEEIWKLYAPKEKDIKNVLPGKVDIEYRDQHSLAFVQELTARRADGEKNHPLRFALPQVLQGTIFLKFFKFHAGARSGSRLGFGYALLKLQLPFGVGLELQVAMQDMNV